MEQPVEKQYDFNKLNKTNEYSGDRTKYYCYDSVDSRQHLPGALMDSVAMIGALRPPTPRDK